MTPHCVAEDLIPLGTSEPESCPYLHDRPAALDYGCLRLRSGEAFDALLASGYRRNGFVFYRPACPLGCRECVPLRVPIETFRPSKRQRRLLRRTREALTVSVGTPCFSRDHLDLFNRHARWVSPTARALSKEEYAGFLLESSVETLQFEYSSAGRAIGVGILDVGRSSSSSVYFFWEPDAKKLSPGTYSILYELEWCRQRGYCHHYLGYWIDGCRSMQYKSRFAPYELLDWRDGSWRPAAEHPDQRR
jgi:arginine-tRNA-protein transferase